MLVQITYIKPPMLFWKTKGSILPPSLPSLNQGRCAERSCLNEGLQNQNEKRFVLFYSFC